MAGQDAASWFSPSSRFFGSDGPFRYDNLRYYMYTGVEPEKVKGRTRPPEGEVSDLEPMEALDESGEPVSLASPIKKPKPKSPIEFHLVDSEGKPMAGIGYEAVLPDGTLKTGESDAEGFIRFPDNIHAGDAKLKLFPKQGHGPAVAAPPVNGATGSDSAPGAGIPQVTPAFLLKPVQILLVDDQGAPMPDTGYRIRWPDGKVESGKSDRTGLISYPHNTQSGDLVLTVTDFGPHTPGGSP